jgi:hypothetical protein
MTKPYSGRHNGSAGPSRSAPQWRMKRVIPTVFQGVSALANPVDFLCELLRPAINQRCLRDREQNFALRPIALERVPDGQERIYKATAHHGAEQHRERQVQIIPSEGELPKSYGIWGEMRGG